VTEGRINAQRPAALQFLQHGRYALEPFPPVGLSAAVRDELTGNDHLLPARLTRTAYPSQICVSFRNRASRPIAVESRATSISEATTEHDDMAPPAKMLSTGKTAVAWSIRQSRCSADIRRLGLRYRYS
jgi:hypothetical protein